MKKYLTFCLLVFAGYCFSQTESTLFLHENFRLMIHADGTARFTKNDEKIIDYLDLTWKMVGDTQLFYREDSLRLVYLSLLAEDSVHRKVCHVDPMLFLQHTEKFPTYLRLSKVYNAAGMMKKEFQFEGKKPDNPEFLTVFTYDPPPYLRTMLRVRLKNIKTWTYIYADGSATPKLQSVVVSKGKR